MPNVYATTQAYVVNLSTEEGKGGQKSLKSCLCRLCMAPYGLVYARTHCFSDLFQKTFFSIIAPILLCMFFC